jgi:hypothetical protein
VRKFEIRCELNRSPVDSLDCHHFVFVGVLIFVQRCYDDNLLSDLPIDVVLQMNTIVANRRRLRQSRPTNNNEKPQTHTNKQHKLLSSFPNNHIDVAIPGRMELFAMNVDLARNVDSLVAKLVEIRIVGRLLTVENDRNFREETTAGRADAQRALDDDAAHVQLDRCVGKDQLTALWHTNALVHVARFERARRHQHFGVARQSNLGLTGARHTAAPRCRIGPQFQAELARDMRRLQSRSLAYPDCL